MTTDVTRAGFPGTATSGDQVAAQRPWLAGLVIGIADAVLVLILMSLTGWLGMSELLGLAFVDGPPWLAGAVMAAFVGLASAVGAWAASRGRDGLTRRALAGVALVLVGWACWAFGWTVWRLEVAGDPSSVPFVPLEVALDALGGLLIPAIVVFVPAALVWVWVVRWWLDRGRPPGSADAARG
jgi:hypothetical protein